MICKVGDTVQWTTWTGATVTKQVAFVDAWSVTCKTDEWGELPMFWEATKWQTLEQAMANVTIIPA